ncbi:MAG: hypothetical protein V1835_00530 [Candidatus Micrarchaeota archaeon]
MVLEGLFKKKEEEKPKTADLEQKRMEEEIAELTLRSHFYKKIIEKYAVMINEYEEKTVPELKSLINRSDETIVALKRRFTDELLEDKLKRGGSAPEFVFTEDFLFVADKIFHYCQQLHHIHANLPVSFWLTMKEAVELQAADPFDRAILLCSLLRAFDAVAKIRVLECENNLIHPVVIAEFEGKSYVLDASQPDSHFTSYSAPTVEGALESFQYDGNKYLKNAYEFSDEEYLEF